MSLCVDCERLNFPTFFTKANKSHGLPIQQKNLASLRQTAKTCDFCALVSKIILFDSPLPEVMIDDDVLCSVCIDHFGDIVSSESGATVASVSKIALRLETGGERGLYPAHGLQIKAPHHGTVDRSTVLRGRIVGPQVDIRLVSKWLDTCATHHGDVCTPGDHDGETTLRVIDVERSCVVELPRDAKYAALSYVWGGVGQVRLLEGTYHKFTQPFGLRRDMDQLPKTIANAMDLTAKLGERYLWVDCLCIIQDDPVDLDIQINQMNVVYGCAALTIVAAAGFNANAGLPGVVPHSRRSLIIDEKIHGIHLVTSLPDFCTSLDASVWETRGWTMQEKVLSKRLIIFTDHQVFYHCNSATWSEDSIWESRDPDFKLLPGGESTTPHMTSIPLVAHFKLTALSKYAHLVRGYQSRKLSYQSDALNAFAGALTSLGKELDTRMVWGLPVSSFDATIAWRSAVHDPALRREQFPSWTWLGWKGGNLPGDIQFRYCDLETLSLVRWHQITAEGDHKPIDNSMHVEPGLSSLPKLEYKFSSVSRPPVQHLLRFWAQSVHLLVGRKPVEKTFPSFRRYNCYEYVVGIHDPAEAEGIRAFAKILLNKRWRQSQPDLLEFILISRIKRRTYGNPEEILDYSPLMLVETNEKGISYRVQLTEVLEHWWALAQPTWKVYTLG